jgi:hypothetical protein
MLAPIALVLATERSRALAESALPGARTEPAPERTRKATRSSQVTQLGRSRLARVALRRS